MDYPEADCELQRAGHLDPLPGFCHCADVACLSGAGRDLSFGDESWRRLYREDPQQELFGEPRAIRERGVDGLLDIYKENLAGLFGDRFLPKSKRLVSSTASPLFEFIFCVGNPNGTALAKRIANHILDKM